MRHMKYLFAYCLLIASMEGFGQKVALLDRKFKQPIIIADTVTVDQVNQGYIPVDTEGPGYLLCQSELPGGNVVETGEYQAQLF